MEILQILLLACFMAIAGLISLWIARIPRLEFLIPIAFVLVRVLVAIFEELETRLFDGPKGGDVIYIALIVVGLSWQERRIASAFKSA